MLEEADLLYGSNTATRDHAQRGCCEPFLDHSLVAGSGDGFDGRAICADV